jgi:hypothetical protein
MNDVWGKSTFLKIVIQQIFYVLSIREGSFRISNFGGKSGDENSRNIEKETEMLVKGTKF